jgi:aminoglycoside phosphotransferase (APT) family kinase protein
MGNTPEHMSADAAAITTTSESSASSGASPSRSVADGLAEILAPFGVGGVADVVRLSGGASRETFRFRADDRVLILQRQRGGDVRDMGIEASVLRAAHAAGMPVAEVVAAATGPSPVGGSYIVSTAVDGETIARKILRDDTFAAARPLLAAQFGEALARLHRLPVDTVPDLVETDQVAQYRELLDHLAQPHPAFELALRWLDDHRPASSGRAIVHGDFRLGNVMIGPDGLRAVLDWELAHISDPLEDLGWLCVKAWRFGGRHPVAGVGEYHDLIDAYAAAAGRDVDLDAVRWWEVLGTLKWGIMCIGQANTHLAGLARSHELAAIGRRVCENEHDLFLALEGRW